MNWVIIILWVLVLFSSYKIAVKLLKKMDLY